MLLAKLQTSERLLTEKRQEGAGSPVNGTGVKGHRPRSLGRQESSELLKIKKVYEDEIADLRYVQACPLPQPHPCNGVGMCYCVPPPKKKKKQFHEAPRFLQWVPVDESFGFS